jgi:hypothetical protein
LLKQNSKDPLVRGSYFSLLKIYRKTRKKKLKDFRKNIIDELDNLKENNPSKYWTLLNDLSLKLFNRNDWLLFNISFNIMSMPLDFLFFNENIPSIISLSVILKSSSEKICSSSIKK